MAGINRRVFLLRSSLIAAAAGAVSSVPGLAGLLGSAGPELPALDGEAADVEGSALSAAGSSGPIVVHVRDISTGEVGILNGTREVVVRDPRLVARLIHVSR